MGRLAFGRGMALAVVLAGCSGVQAFGRSGVRAFVCSAETTGELVVRFREGVSAARRAQILGASGARVALRARGADFSVLRPRAGSSLADNLRALARRGEVAIAEPNYRARASALVPSLTAYQWNLMDRGTVCGQAVSSFGINAPAAWRLSVGTGVTIALLDTGCAYAEDGAYHQAPDLAQARIRPGWDFVNGDGYPDDDNGHGTHVATSLVAPPNESVGTAGVAPGCTIMPIKVLGADESGSYANIASGIRYAADQGAQILNLSLAGTQPSAILAEAVQYAAGKGCLIVAAAGNDARASAGYPARYAPCVAVGATRFDGRLAPYSNRGEGLTMVAPGGDTTVDQNGDGYPDGILSQTFDPRKGNDSFGYYFYAGTSMAAPQVSGAAALALAADPHLDAAGLRQVLISSTTRLSHRAWDPNFGCGLVNAAGAVQYALAQASRERAAAAPAPALRERVARRRRGA